MTKLLSEWTLEEVQEMCKDHTGCEDCSLLNSKRICFRNQHPSYWELEEND